METCDCTTYCGDDPRLKTKKVRPCNMKLAEIKRKEDLKTLSENLKKLSTEMDGENSQILIKAAEVIYAIY